MLVGYARVSTPDQKLDAQLDRLDAAGCDRVFSDVASGAASDRPGLAELLDFVRPDDTVVVFKLDRLGRSLRHLLETVSGLESAGVGFRSLEESLDTTTTGGRLVFHVFGAISEFERDVIRERTQAGLAAARARGRRGGRPRALSPEQVNMARAMLADASTPVRSVYKTLGVGRTTLYRYLSESAGPAAEAARVKEPESANRRRPRHTRRKSAT
jgi:DNA invertase Pin-like site-specific DNA recombinase